MTKVLLTKKILPRFERGRLNVNNGLPYRQNSTHRGQLIQLRTIDLLGMALWFLKCKNPAYRICTVFGVVLISMHVGIDYAMEVLVRTVRRPNLTDFEINWPSEKQMQQSALLIEHNLTHEHLLRGVFTVLDGGTNALRNLHR